MKQRAVVPPELGVEVDVAARCNIEAKLCESADMRKQALTPKMEGQDVLENLEACKQVYRSPSNKRFAASGQGQSKFCYLF